MYEVGVRGPVSAAHFLRGDFGDETRPHAHRYLVDWECGVAKVDANGFAVDIALMEKLLAGAAEGLAGVLLNDLLFFRERQPSVEHFAEYLHGLLLDGLRRSPAGAPALHHSRVRVWESDTAWAAHATE
jgi:6-pyruvoyl-tetrahydropterin synthase